MKALSRRAASLAVAGITLATVSVGTAADASASTAKPPLLKATISKSGLTIAGATTLRPGRLAVSLHAVGDERELELISIHKGYTFAKFKADVAAFGASAGPKGPTPAGLKHLRSAVSHTTLYGGLDADAGKTVRMTVLLPKAGRYYLYNDGGGVPANQKRFTLKGSFAHRTAPKSTAVVTATTAERFGGASVLPAHGTITFHNTSTTSPHLLGLAHVKKGTTRQQIIEALSSGSNSQPAFALPGFAGTDSIGPGMSQTLDLSLPAGTYAEVCFFPDLQTGMPHALMGMIRIVTLK